VNGVKIKGQHMQQLRLYSFVNFYLSSIQQGVQTGHAAVDLVRKYNAPKGTPSQLGKNCDMVGEWADNHKTFIILNGGNNEMLLNTKEIVKASGLPWVTFSEDEQSLGGILTTVAVVVPEMYFASRFVPVDIVPFPRNTVESYEWIDDSGKYHRVNAGTPEFNFVQLLKSSRLAS
jgi:hypothetical protein